MQTANLLLHQLRSGTSEEAEEDASQRARSTKPPSADGVRDQLTGAMTISALLAGFAVGLSTTVTADEIRDYARWLNSYHAYARFAQLNKDWKIPTEAGSPQPSYGCGEDDKDAAIPDRQRTPRIIQTRWLFKLKPAVGSQITTSVTR